MVIFRKICFGTRSASPTVYKTRLGFKNEDIGPINEKGIMFCVAKT